MTCTCNNRKSPDDYGAGLLKHVDKHQLARIMLAALPAWGIISDESERHAPLTDMGIDILHVDMVYVAERVLHDILLVEAGSSIQVDAELEGFLAEHVTKDEKLDETRDGLCDRCLDCELVELRATNESLKRAPWS